MNDKQSIVNNNSIDVITNSHVSRTIDQFAPSTTLLLSPDSTIILVAQETPWTDPRIQE
jgi:hypothetical protein